ncbi:hypothetical protein JW960_22070 [candidate division KSB1 bacterium]|nr:hypothetical protein [candidate division KSB1 bacterium]
MIKKREIAGSLPSIFMGNFNLTPESDAHELFCGKTGAADISVAILLTAGRRFTNQSWMQALSMVSRVRNPRDVSTGFWRRRILLSTILR